MTIAPLKTTGKLKRLNETTNQGVTRPKKSPAVLFALFLMVLAFFLLTIGAVWSLPYLATYAGLSAASGILTGILSLRE